MKKKFWLITGCLIILSLFVVLLIEPTIKGINYGLDFKGGFEVLYKVENLNGKGNVSKEMLKSTYKSLINRIDTLGVSEPEIIIEGENIRVKLPGIKNENEARERLSTPAVLSFRNTSDEELMNASVLKNPGASLDYDSKTNKPVVALSIKDNKKFYNITKEISESEDQTIVIWLDFEEGVDSYIAQSKTCGEAENKKCISAATVTEGFMNNVIIQGNFSEEDASSLTDLINSGSLPTKLVELSTKTVDATLGNETIEIIFTAFILSLILITLILTFKYRFSGFISSICLFIYTVLVFLVYNQIGGVLTLPGIAAMVLGIGMAVDSSIISIERIKDESRESKSLKYAFKDGNKRSLIAIIDANITTFLAAFILFIYGESSVKGFATMLIVTIIITIFTMVYLNRFILKKYVESEIFDKKQNFFFGKVKDCKKFDFVKNSKIFISLSLIVIIVGTIFILSNGLNLGIDFKGGSIINVTGEEKLDENIIEKTLEKYDLTTVNKISDNEISYNIKNSLQKTDINEIKNDLKDYSVDITSISSVVKKELTKNAFISLILACIGIVIYVAIRFNYNFGISAIITLIHDVLIVILIFAIIQLEVNFIFVASILTIIGYSINDTIVLFDRIRENRKIMYKDNVRTEKELIEVINKSSNETISRNLWTSITTISSLIILICMNINELLSFNISLLIGLIAGSFSSLFIAPYLYFIFERRILNGKTKKRIYEDELDEKSIKGINS